MAPPDANAASTKSKKGKNPFRDSYKPEAPHAVTSASSNPFGEEEVPESHSATSNSNKSSNPFRDSYKEAEENLQNDRSANPFDADVVAAAPNNNADSRLVRQSPKTKQTVTRANPILELRTPTSTGGGGSGKDNSAHGSDPDTPSERGQEFASERSVVAHAGKSKGEPGNPIYYLNRFSDWWLLAFLLVHVGQFILLLTVGYQALRHGGFGVVVGLAVLVVIMVLAAR
jgi:hypothetical protein